MDLGAGEGGFGRFGSGEQGRVEASIFCGLEFCNGVQMIHTGFHEEKFFEVDMAQVVEPNMGIRLFGNTRQRFHGFHRRQHWLPLKMVVHQMTWGVQGHGDSYRWVYLGKMSHNRTVLGSTSTGVPDALVAQWRVNPLQTISPVSPWVMT